ncbi:Phosphoglycerate mutase family protein [Trifolium repens]|nr:Phosphoglycerate mutase family protein [Trifolium repens]
MDSRRKKILGNQHLIPYQNVVIMRHGERLDNIEPSWASTASRPWDPPLAQAGRIRAFQMGQCIQQSLKYPIHRVFVSPFLRCVQTVVELISALPTINNDLKTDIGEDSFIDNSKVKVSIEYGLCEVINNVAIRPNVAPKDKNISFDIPEREAMLPAGTVDYNVQKVYNELPQWGESFLQARARYQQTIKELADKYPTENLLFLTHGEGLQTALSSTRKDGVNAKLQYCAYVELRRPIFNKDQSFDSGEFNLLPHYSQTGVSYISSNDP